MNPHPMPKHAAPAALPLVISPPDPLRGLLHAGGYAAELVVRRLDGTPLSPRDRKNAARLVEESENRDTPTMTLAERVQAELDAEESATRTKRATGGSRAAYTARTAPGSKASAKKPPPPRFER